MLKAVIDKQYIALVLHYTQPHNHFALLEFKLLQKVNKISKQVYNYVIYADL